MKALVERLSRARRNAEINRLARNVAWSSFGVVLSQVITLLAYILLARVIGKDRFGHFTIIQTMANTISIFAGLGLGVTATKYIAELRDREPRRAGVVFTLIAAITALWTGLLALGVFGLAPQIATEALQKADLTSAVRVGAILLFFATVLNVQNGTLAGFESFDAVAKTTLLRGFLILLLLFVGGKLGGVLGALIGFASANAISCLINHVLIQRRCRRYSMPTTLNGSLRELRFLASFSVPAFLTNIIPAPCLSLAQMYLIRFPGGYGDLAVFTAAFQVRAGIVLLPTLLSQPLIPMLASADKDGPSSRRQLLRATLAATLLVAVGLATLVCIFPKYIMMAYGHAFTGNNVILIILAGSAVVGSVTNPFTAAVMSSGKMWELSLAYALWCASFLGVTYGLIPFFHGTALALAYLVADSIQAIAVYILYRHNEKRLQRDFDASAASAGELSAPQA